jgi:uncharacterized protein YggE
MTRLSQPFHRLVLALALGVAAMSPTHAQVPAGAAFATADGTLLAVSSHAEVRRAPDIATLATGVVTQAADANAAMRANAEQMEKVVAAIRAAGIESRDIRTSGINLNPQYRYAENQPPAITGYQASNTVDITVRDIARLGKILDALVATGANQINGPSFDVENRDGALDEARRKAVEKAQARARIYAESLGMRVRRIVSISEGAQIGPPVPMMAMRMEKSMDASTPVSPGENVLGVNLEIVFELGK